MATTTAAVECKRAKKKKQRRCLMRVCFNDEVVRDKTVLFAAVALDSSITVAEAIEQIAIKHGFPDYTESVGLFDSGQGVWLDDEKTLADYYPENDIFVEHIEFKKRAAPADAAASAEKEEDLGSSTTQSSAAVESLTADRKSKSSSVLESVAAMPLSCLKHNESKRCLMRVCFNDEVVQDKTVLMAAIALNSCITVAEAIAQISRKHGIPDYATGVGLFDCDKNLWLDDEKTLEEYYPETDIFVEHVEFKKRPEDATKGDLQSSVTLSSSLARSLAKDRKSKSTLNLVEGLPRGLKKSSHAGTPPEESAEPMSIKHNKVADEAAPKIPSSISVQEGLSHEWKHSKVVPENLDQLVALTVHNCANLPTDVKAPDSFVKLYDANHTKVPRATGVANHTRNPVFAHTFRVPAHSCVRLEVWYLGVLDKFLGEVRFTPADYAGNGVCKFELRDHGKTADAATVPEGGARGNILISVSLHKPELQQRAQVQGHAKLKSERILKSVSGHAFSSLVNFGLRGSTVQV
eukprot:TRINITY_DN3084_c0_g1_i1.p1 TRINITY_DN3084_c0_g1~~TRINITY_DN3084_c0_g1_i1.p1  ORF type:complete len:528 (-),score=174.21 TRINITY_DN3084_c0_g1_i1:54-1616(-)